MKFNLKKILKQIKLNEGNISMVLGALVIVITGVLVSNYFKDKKAESLPDFAAQTGDPKEHIVVEGETLWSIAEDSFGSGYNWVDIMQENGLETENIEVGQKLTIPDVSGKKPTATKTVTELSQDVTVADSEAQTGNTHTVVKGESLWDIAVDAYGDGHRWVEIAKANGLTNPDIIHTGNVLTLPR